MSELSRKDDGPELEPERRVEQLAEADVDLIQQTQRRWRSMCRPGTYPLVLIEWVDAYGVTPNWEDVAELEVDLTCPRTVGWLLLEDDTKLVVASTVSLDPDGDPQAVGVMVIPKVAVMNRKDLS